MAEWKDARRVELLHRLRDDARLRVARAKQQQRVQTYDDLIDRVADAIDGPGAEALTGKLRAQYAVALVDEFQDTDARRSEEHTSELQSIMRISSAVFCLKKKK